MSNVKVREDGYYLARRFEDSSLAILYLDSTGSARESDGYWIEQNLYYWIADEPLDLESIRLLMMNGGLENAVEVVKRDSSKTSSVLFLEKELKRYKDWYGDMDSLSR